MLAYREAQPGADIQPVTAAERTAAQPLPRPEPSSQSVPVYRASRSEAEAARSTDRTGTVSPVAPEAATPQQTEGAVPRDAALDEPETGEAIRAIPDDQPLAARSREEQISLTYAQLPQDIQRGAERPDTPEAAAPKGQVEPVGFQSLPDWAQNMLRRTGGIPEESFSGPGTFQYDAGRAGAQAAAGIPGSGNRGIPPAGGGKQITWTAPGYAGFSPTASAPTGPAQMVFRDRENEPENEHPQRKGMDERELRKTADKVYRLIEERLRKELRRGGR